MKHHPKLVVGTEGKNHKGFKYIIEAVNSATDVVVRFLEPQEAYVKTQAACIRSGLFNTPMERTVAGVGYFGQGKYNCKTHPKIFERWYSIFRRIYLEPHKAGNKSYAGASVCEEWQNFQNFAAWMEDQGIEDYSWHLDKDLLVKGNKIYSPETCVFLPMEVNVFFTRRKSLRGDAPIGCSKRKDRYLVQWTRGSVAQYEGSFATPEEAFACYKAAKESYAHELANKWRNKIDPRAYEALMNYTVEITD